MDRQIESANININEEFRTKRSHRPAHLMCLTPLWGVAGFFGCAYFSWVSWMHITHNEYVWPHDGWTAATYIVWILLLTGLTFDTRCRRERLFFGLLVIIFLIGCGLTLWSGISSAEIRTARIATGALWAAAALVSLTTLGGAPELRSKDV
jgi:hypothetical protein